MKTKTIAAALMLCVAALAEPIFDPSTRRWTFVSDNPEAIHNAIRNERSLERKISLLNAARLRALSKTNLLTVVTRPSDNPPQPRVRVYSKMKCVIELTQMGVWPQVKQWIVDNNLYDIYLAAQDFRSDDPNFVGGVQTLKVQLGLTDAQIEALLMKCIAD